MALTLAGCASTGTGVVPEGPDSFMISKECGYGSMSSGRIKAEAMREGAEYCAKSDRQFMLVGSTDSPTWPGHFCTAEIQFMCLKAGDPQLTRVRMEPVAPKQVIETRQPASR